MFKSIRLYSVTVAIFAVASASAQTPAADPSARLRQVLPADVADRVLAKIADARARQLPAAALENRALRLSSDKVSPADIEKSVNAHADRMQKTKDAIEKNRSAKASDDEVDKGAEAMRKGVDGAKISELAKSAPSGRSLAVPLVVIGSLVDRGLPSDEALKKVQEKLQAKATDRELEQLPGSVASTKKPATAGQDLSGSKRPAGAGRPASVPANAGKPTSTGTKPPTPTKKP